MKKRDLGFTLIELMIVVTIIGLLSSLILVGLRRVQSLGRDTRRIADLRQIQTGLETYFNRNQYYPQLANSSWTSVGDPFPAALVGAGIGITAVSTDPLNRSSFVYYYSSASPWTGYVLRTLLENNDNPALRDDVDGASVFGLDCGPTGYPEGTAGSNSYYCVST